MSEVDQVSCATVAPTGIYDRPWRRLTDELRRLIVAGRWQPGDRLPTQRELAAIVDAGSRGTVQRAVDQLRAEGYVTTRQGSGTRVAPRESWPTEGAP